MPSDIANPLGEVITHNSQVRSARGMQALSASPLSELTYTAANKDKFIRKGHVLQYNYRSSLHMGNEVCKAAALQGLTNIILVAGVSIIDSNAWRERSEEWVSDDISFNDGYWERITFITDGEAYLRKDPKAVTTIATGIKVEVTDITDSAADATYSNEYRYGTVVDVTDNDTHNVHVGYATEAQWTYIPFDKDSYDYNSGSGIPIVRVKLDLPVAPVTI